MVRGEDFYDNFDIKFDGLVIIFIFLRIVFRIGFVFLLNYVWWILSSLLCVYISNLIVCFFRFVIILL